MKTIKRFLCCIGCIAVGLFVIVLLIGGTNEQNVVVSNWQPETISTPKPPSVSITYTPMDVPNINSSFKSWMDYKTVTNKQSNQYKYITQYGWVDNQGFVRANGDLEYGITDDYYLIALGSYYGTTIGTKYRITTDTGNVFYGVLADCKADIHTDSSNRYNTWSNNVVEFIVDSKILNKDVKLHGSANVYMPLNGSIVSIEKINFSN